MKDYFEYFEISDEIAENIEYFKNYNYYILQLYNLMHNKKIYINPIIDNLKINKVELNNEYNYIKLYIDNIQYLYENIEKMQYLYQNIKMIDYINKTVYVKPEYFISKLLQKLTDNTQIELNEKLISSMKNSILGHKSFALWMKKNNLHLEILNMSTFLDDKTPNYTKSILNFDKYLTLYKLLSVDNNLNIILLKNNQNEIVTYNLLWNLPDNNKYIDEIHITENIPNFNIEGYYMHLEKSTGYIHYLNLTNNDKLINDIQIKYNTQNLKKIYNLILNDDNNIYYHEIDSFNIEKCSYNENCNQIILYNKFVNPNGKTSMLKLLKNL